jgi:hypothetical protein
LNHNCSSRNIQSGVRSSLGRRPADRWAVIRLPAERLLREPVAQSSQLTFPPNEALRGGA